MPHRAAFIAIAFAGCAADAQPVQKSIYTCVDGKGSKLTSDRPIPECADREQRVLNKDGSLMRVVPPMLTTTEERTAAEGRAKVNDAIQRDRSLKARVPSGSASRP